MGKNLVLIQIILMLFVLSACNPIILPSGIQLKGEAEARFDAKMNLGSMFSDLLEDAVEDNEDDMSVLHCVNTTAQTYVVYIPLFPSDGQEGEFKVTYKGITPSLPDFPDLNFDANVFYNGTDYTKEYLLASPSYLINPEDPIKLPLSSIGELLEGFEFDRYQTKLYFSGSEIFNKLSIDITINNETTIIQSKEMASSGDITIDNQSSGWNVSWGGNTKEYKGTRSPNGGLEIDVPLDGRDVELDFKVYFPAGTKLVLEDFKEGFINIEFVIWLPLIFKAVEDGATIRLPDGALFSASKDLFGRKNNEEAGIIQYIEKLSLNIEFDKNPFKGSELVVVSQAELGERIEIKRRLTGNSLSFAISEENLEKINKPENWPFIPNFTMVYAQGAILTLPREFKTKSFVFNAQINQKYLFGN